MSWYWQKIIPSKFHKNSGLLNYEFIVRYPYPGPHNYMYPSFKTKRKILTSVYCEVLINNKTQYLFIPKTADAYLYQAISLFVKTLYIGNRIHRYLNMYKAYECLATKPDLILKAIRDGLSHPSTVLTSKNTQQNLISVFGETQIDINKFKHERLFFTYLGQLLKVTDKLIFDRIKSELDNFYHVKYSLDEILEWRMNHYREL